MIQKKIYIIIAILIFFVAQSDAANWYVDNSVSSSGDGQSWATAWKNLSDISWGSISGSDTLYISGGSTSKNYNENFIVGASGTVGNPITIKSGGSSPSPSGHEGTVNLKGGSNSPWTGITISGKNYITVSGQIGTFSDKKIRATAAGLAGIDLSNSDHIILEYIEIDNNGNQTDHHGLVGVWTSPAHPTDLELRYLHIHDNYQDGIDWTVNEIASGYGLVRIHDCVIENIYDDGIETAMGFDLYNNILQNRRPLRDGQSGHPDFLQIKGKYYRIYNNYFHGWREEPQGSNAYIYWEPISSESSPVGHIQIYNNVFHDTSTNATLRTIGIDASKATFTSLTDIYILNNTFIGQAPTFILNQTYIGGSDFTNFYMENNIFYNSTGFVFGDHIPGTDHVTVGRHTNTSASINFDYNNFNPSNTISYQGTEYSYANFKTLTSAQEYSVTSNPDLNSDYKPQSNSPVLDKGISYSSLFTSDKCGVTRPQGSAWDIGAYEYNRNIDLGTSAPNITIGTGAGNWTW